MPCVALLHAPTDCPNICTIQSVLFPLEKADIQVAEEGLAAMEAWMKELGLAMNLSEVGVTPDMIEDIVNGTLIMEGGYKVLSKGDVRAVLKKAME